MHNYAFVVQKFSVPFIRFIHFFDPKLTTICLMLKYKSFIDRRSGLFFCSLALQPLFSSLFVCQSNKNPNRTLLELFKPENVPEIYYVKHLAMYEKKRKKNPFECLENHLNALIRKPFEIIFTCAQITHVPRGSRDPYSPPLALFFVSDCVLCSS